MRSRLALATTVGGFVVVAMSLPLDAHKPITSPYTFNDDVFPILRDRCSACHVSGGAAPMALTTAEETVPWGESIRLELIAGHMPPWAAISNDARMAHAEGLTARELNVLLTWITGGTPTGATGKALPALAPAPEWPLGTPDAVVTLPEATLAADQAELTREFVLPLDTAARRPLRAVDLRPGTRAMVRSAHVFVRAPDAAGNIERLLAAWVPGDRPTALPAGTVFAMPPGAELVVRVRYKKNWQHEREVMRDQSAVGLYFADGAGEPLRTWTFVAPPSGEHASGGVVSRATLDASLRAVSIYPTDALAGADVKVDAIGPGAARRLIAFTPRTGWERRYWFESPFDLPAGTTLQVTATFTAEGAHPPPGAPLLVLNAVPSSAR